LGGRGWKKERIRGRWYLYKNGRSSLNREKEANNRYGEDKRI
jgi:hypothetical protein